MNAMNVAITRKTHRAAEELLGSAGCGVWTNPHDRALTPAELREAAAGSDATICMLSDAIGAGLFAAAPRCRIYANYAVGHNNMDAAAAARAGVALCNTPDVLTDATAELAWALLFAVARRVPEGDRMVREGRFHGWAPLMLLGHDVGGRTLGIIGAGRIGAAMARRAAGFAMPILYTRRSGRSPEMDALGARHVSLDELLRESDYISIHCPLTTETRHMIGATQFAIMKPGAIIINTARGAVIDERALAAALREGRIAGAGLDVYEHEPDIEPELPAMSNTVLLPHIGSATFDTRRRMAELAARNILDYFEGRVPRTCLNPGTIGRR